MGSRTVQSCNAPLQPNPKKFNHGFLDLFSHLNLNWRCANNSDLLRNWELSLKSFFSREWQATNCGVWIYSQQYIYSQPLWKAHWNCCWTSLTILGNALLKALSGGQCPANGTRKRPLWTYLLNNLLLNWDNSEIQSQTDC